MARLPTLVCPTCYTVSSVRCVYSTPSSPSVIMPGAVLDHGVNRHHYATGHGPLHRRRRGRGLEDFPMIDEARRVTTSDREPRRGSRGFLVSSERGKNHRLHPRGTYDARANACIDTSREASSLFEQPGDTSHSTWLSVGGRTRHGFPAPHCRPWRSRPRQRKWHDARCPAVARQLLDPPTHREPAQLSPDCAPRPPRQAARRRKISICAGLLAFRNGLPRPA